ncbi:unnamed protein product, partial [Clonostachys solani]
PPPFSSQRSPKLVNNLHPNTMPPQGNNHAFHRAATASRSGSHRIANPPTKRSPGPIDGYCQGLGDGGRDIDCWWDNQFPLDAVDELLFPCTWHETQLGCASCDGQHIYTGYDSPSPAPQPAPAKGGIKDKTANARTKSKSSKPAAANKHSSVGRHKPRPATKKGPSKNC